MTPDHQEIPANDEDAGIGYLTCMKGSTSFYTLGQIAKHQQYLLKRVAKYLIGTREVFYR
jgi:hypothetical protein